MTPPAAPMVVALSVVSHGHRADIDRMLSSFDRHLDPAGCELRILITQNIPDPTAAPFRSRFAISTLENPAPKGFGANHNQAFRVAAPDWFIVANPDIWLDRPLRLSGLCGAGQADAILSASVRDADGRMADFRRACLTPRSLLRRHLGRSDDRDPERPDPEHPDPHHWFAAIFLAVPARTYAALSGFDERYFLYVEDCDLGWRARRQGYDLRVHPDWVVLHGAQRRSRRSLRHLRWHVAGLLRFWGKLAAARLRGAGSLAFGPKDGRNG